MPLNYSEVKSLPLNRQERTSISPPLGVCYLSSYLKERGYRVSILDLDVETFNLVKTKGTYTIHDIVYLIKDKGHFDVMGISCLTSARYKKAHALAEIGKWLGMTTIMGGNYPTNSPKMALDDKNVDYVVLGEGEETFYKLLRSIEEDAGLEEIDGVGYKNTIRNKKSFIQDLDLLPYPDYENLDIEKYYKVGMSQSWDGNNRFFTLITSRGCPNQCTYCVSHNTFGYKNRVRSVENVLKEVDWVKNKFGANDILLQDDNFTKDKPRAKEIIDGLRLRGLKWSIPNGLEVNTIDRDFLEKVKASGCVDLTLAIESGSPKTLKMIKKSVDLNHAKEVINIMRELGIYSKVFFMIGFPGETKEDIQQTIDYASNLKPDWSLFSIVNPLPGSEIGKENPVFEDMGYANANISTKDFTAEDIQKIVYDANIKINFLENPNISRNPQLAKRDFKRILDRYPEHTIARRAFENLYYC